MKRGVARVVTREELSTLEYRRGRRLYGERNWVRDHREVNSTRVPTRTGMIWREEQLGVVTREK